MTATAIDQPRHRNKRITDLIDEDGEVYRVTRQRDPKRSYNRVFHTTFDDAEEKIFARINSAATFKVLRAVKTLLTHKTWRRIDQQALAAKLGIGIGSANRALAELVELKVIERRGKAQQVEWRLTLHLIWRSDVDDYHAVREERGLNMADALPPELVESRRIYTKEARPGERQSGALKGNTKQTRLRLLTTVKPASQSAPKASA
jgi:hypothetical protein